ncbi:TIGR00153 family protein [Thermococcus gammatolerans]|uniref:Phosphate transport regulator, putative n=1 Tax=Thermococcus gammatolerans (strain DSM 15229 / JCM 11827 / EJ3) TaxID=593117 RepID=C5A3L1_THEGJ|nr:TIGR00153 family protein [Thermococcus gammatolerans]ACS32823.1 Phosphate transport regulator, putative [Thermococcus gammatolerans EJ3]
MAIFGGKENDVFKALNDHLEVVHETLKAFRALVESYLAGRINEAEKFEREVSELETKADKLRRSIEMMLYEGAFLPANRGDYVRLSELVDQVADAAESAAHTIILAKPRVPGELSGEFLALVDSGIDTYEKLMKAVKALNTDVDRAMDLAKQVEDAEEKADEIEYNLKKHVFESEEITTYAKIIWNQIITKIGDIADRAEDASDQVLLMSVKRRG